MSGTGNLVEKNLRVLAVVGIVLFGLFTIIASSGGGGGGGSSSSNNGTGTSAISYKVNEDDWRLVSNKIDVGDNGTIDHVEKRVYDAQGNLIQETLDRGNDGSIDEYKNYTYDSSNFLTSISVDADRNGIYETHTLTTNGFGLPILDAVDFDGDTVVDYRVSYTYDANGYPASFTFTNLNNVERAVYWIWDEASPSIDDTNRQTHYSSADPLQNFSYDYVYNSKGEKTSEAQDMDDDGSVDSLTTWEFSELGNRKIEKEDVDNDGTYERVTYTTYDASGNEIVEEVDRNDTGSMDEAQYFTYDAYGNKIKEEDDDNFDGTPDEVEYFSYAEDGSGNLLVTWETDEDGDGHVDYVQNLTLEPKP